MERITLTRHRDYFKGSVESRPRPIEVCFRGIHLWFELPKQIQTFDLLISDEKFKRSIKIKPVDGSNFLVQARTLKKEWKQIAVMLSFYPILFPTLSPREKVYVGVEYD